MSPPTPEVVDVLASLAPRWPDAVLERMVELLGYDLSELLRSSVESAIEAFITGQQRQERVLALLSQRCAATRRCQSPSSHKAVEDFIKTLKEIDSDGDLPSIFGHDSSLGNDLELGIDGGSCPELLPELRELARYADGVPLDVEMGLSEAGLCDPTAMTASDAGIHAAGCAWVALHWSEYQMGKQIQRQMAAQP